jgi:hypothetical protein
MPVIETIAAVVDRHEKLLYGLDNYHVGLKAKVIELERFISELKVERKEASDDRRKIMTGVVAAIIIQLVGLVVAVQQHLGG